MRTTLTLAATAAFLFMAPAFAADTTQPQTYSGNEVICKTLQAPTGSRFGVRKTCMTHNEWEAQRQADRATTDAAQAHSLSAAPPDGGAGNVH